MATEGAKVQFDVRWTRMIRNLGGLAKVDQLGLASAPTMDPITVRKVFAAGYANDHDLRCVDAGALPRAACLAESFA